MTEITPDLVLRAYTIGYFPMAEHRGDNDLFWVCPDRRGIIPLDNVHIPRKLRSALRDDNHTVTCNQDFRGVLQGCAEAKPKRQDTWISPRIMELFCALHDMGFAHSIEVWNKKNQLVGGLYGVALGGAFFGESMFSRETDMSKIALMHLIARLRHSQFQLLDTQFITKHLQQFGAVEISKDEYIEKLESALQIRTRFYTGQMNQDLLLSALPQPNTVTS
ncbi:MAG: leucyl/phenylalanyl-tRNA--protein transferase [Alphaproteobacteria bacterium]|nr:MAG: leucyl/phenylalanyl-tRNA--protein transferase [Alphaproteobacteria bacterium]